MFHPGFSRLGAAAVVLLGLVASNPACARSGRTSAYIDLIHLLPGAQKRSALAADRAFQLVDADVGGEVRPSIQTCGASRIIWTVSLPDNPVLRAAIAVNRARSAGLRPLAFRVGVGGRVYEQLFRQEFSPAVGASASGDRWQPVSVSLRAYHGWQWSVFYRPSSMAWPIIFSLDAGLEPDGRTECGYWATPRVESAR